MHFARSINVRTQLTLAFLLVILITWLVSTVLVASINADEILSLRRELQRQSWQHPTTPSTFAPRTSLEKYPLLQLMLQRRDRRQIPFIRFGVAIVISLVAGALLSRRFTRPLVTLSHGAQAFNAGLLDHRIDLPGEDEFGRMAASMNAMAEQLERQIRSLEDDAYRRQQLLADVAHELRSPLATMRAMAEAVRDGVASDSERRAFALDSLVRHAERLQRLVNDLMEVAKLDMHELPMHRETVNLSALVLDSLNAHRTAATQAGITLLPLESIPEITVTGDTHRLAQVVDNLLENAIQYAGRGAAVRVDIDCDDPIRLEISDSGRGIAAEHLPFLFDPFYRVDPARTPSEQHSGLGLRIARGLVEAHGGTLSIASVVGQGTTATIVLPQ